MEDHRDNLVVIVAGYSDRMAEFIDSNPGLKSRFNKFIEFEDYSAEELFEIFKKMVNDVGFEASEEALEYTRKWIDVKNRGIKESGNDFYFGLKPKTKKELIQMSPVWRPTTKPADLQYAYQIPEEEMHMALIKCPECGQEISDSLKRCHHCGIKIKKVKEKRVFSKKQKIIFIAAGVVLVAALAVGGVFLVNKVIKPANAYRTAEKLLDEGKYEEALAGFEKLGNYKDSPNRMNETHYRHALNMIESGEYEDAVNILKNLDEYSDSTNMIKEAQYRQAKHFVETDNFDDALSLFSLLDGYSDSSTLIKETYYKKAIAEYNDGKYLEAKKDFKASGNYGDTATYLLKIEDLEKKEATEEAHRKNVNLLKSAYNAVKSNSRITLASDGLSITVDSKNEYDYTSLLDILTIITKLKLPDSLYDAMVSTNSLMGRQSETYNAWKVSWSYHPKNGLDAIFKLVE